MARELTRTNVKRIESPLYRAYLLPLVAAGVLLLFLSAPWSLHHKAHVALHGLCAQRPSHSFVMGGERLPFDARMTGIYGGFVVAAAYLVLRRRYLAAALPSTSSLALLVLFVGAMAVDGFNSTLFDLRAWHLYQPDNYLRLATGLLTGIALAVAICYMIAVTLWRRPELAAAPVAGPRELAVLVALQAPFAAAVAGKVGVFFAPVTLLLLLSATAVLTALALVVVALLRRREGMFSSGAEVQGPATAALLLGLAVMAALGGGRFLLEHLTGAPPLT